MAPTSTTTTVATSPSTAPPSFTGDEGSPFCALLADVDLAGALTGSSADPDAVGRVVQGLADVLVEAAELAPGDIAADVALVADGMVSLDGALAEVGYDFDALAASGSGDEVLAAVNDPAFAAAGTRLAAYRAQVCRL